MNLTEILSKPPPVAIKFVAKKESNAQKNTNSGLVFPEINRDKEIRRLEIRFKDSIQIKQENQYTILEFIFKPTDPDYIKNYPNLNKFLTELCVPLKYPHSESEFVLLRFPCCEKKVLNEISQSFLKYQRCMPVMNLMKYINWLDKQFNSRVFEEPLIEKESRVTEASNPPDKENKETKRNPDENIQSKPGTDIKISDMEFVNIAYAQCSDIGLVVLCMKCKTRMDIRCVNTVPIEVLCTTCKLVFIVSYYKNTVHSNDYLVGKCIPFRCNVVDVTTLNFSVVCLNCDTETILKKVVISVLKQHTCFECHNKMKLFIKEIKFYNTTTTLQKDFDPSSKKLYVPVEKIKSALGTPLPNNGACKHYKRSFRWLRFPCCGKIYACDKCHDEQKNDAHLLEWATSMICGFCSKEQKYSKEKCVCGAELTNSSKGKMFWEGGKGTRDRSKMSKNDPKKYAGLSKTTPKASRKD